MSGATTVAAKYGSILKERRPGVIHGVREYEKARRQAEALIDRDSLPPQEERYLELLVALIERYEDERFALPRSTPLEALKELMLARSTSQSELAVLIGSKGNASEILSGARDISKNVARKLADHFRVPVDLFV